MSAINKKERIKVSKETWSKGLRIFRYILPYKFSFIIGFIILAFSSVVFMLFTASGGEFIKIAEGKSRFNLSLDQFGLILLAVLLIQGVLSFIRVQLFAYLSEKSMADVRKQLFAKLVSMPMSFYDKNKVGELTSRATADVQQIQEVVSVTLAEFLRQIIVLIVGISIIIYLNSKLTLLMLLTFPIVMIIAIIWGKKIRKHSKERQDKLAESTNILEESLQNITVVKSFTNESWETNRYNASLDKVVSFALKLARHRGGFISFIISVVFGVVFFVIYNAAKLVQSGEITSGDLVSFITVTAVVGASIGSLGDFYTQILKAIGASERVLDIIDLEGEIIDNNASPQAIQGHIQYTDVKFRYPTRDDVEVLKGLSFEILPGTTAAFVGSSGAGKSTVIQLLLKMYNVTEGTITVDGRSIASIDLYTLRKNIAIVPQEVILFGGSILENIQYGNIDATEKDIIEAAKKANAWEFIESFPDGLQTIVGDRGIKLSGGQRQRIAIARAVLKNPTILILDEATSSLDAESERLVQDALDKLMKNRTSLVIAHRLSTIRNADKIIVLDKGMKIEEGTHDQLINIEDGFYQHLAELQFTEA